MLCEVEPRQHHFPAVLSGQFGHPSERPAKNKARQRIVCVARRGSDDIKELPAEHVGWSNKQRRLYDLPGVHEDASIDSLWGPVESRVPALVAALTRFRKDEGLQLDQFVRALVPLAAQLLVRHPEFGERYRERVDRRNADLDIPPVNVSIDMVNVARNIDYLCLCGALAERQWCLLRSPQPLITSELGYCELSVAYEANMLSGYAFPVHRNIAVYACDGPANEVVGQLVRLQERNLDPSEADAMNTTMAGWSPGVILGDRRSVRRAMDVWPTQNGPSTFSKSVPAAVVGPTGLTSAQAERWFRRLHEAQSAMEPTIAHRDFGECRSCAAQVQWVRDMFSEHGETMKRAVVGGRSKSTSRNGEID